MGDGTVKTTNRANKGLHRRPKSSSRGRAVLVASSKKSPLYDIADYFLGKAYRDDECLSNMKLQKLIYYAQGLHLIFYGSALFPEQIKAWEHGPVVPQLYHKYKKFGASGIPIDILAKEPSIKKDTKKFLDEVYSVFGQFSATRLRDITHSDECWKEARPTNGTITHDAMRKSLRKYVKKEG